MCTRLESAAGLSLFSAAWLKVLNFSDRLYKDTRCVAAFTAQSLSVYSAKKSTYGTSLGVELQETPISSLAFPLYTVVVCFVVLLFCTCVSGTFVANAYFLQLLLVKYYVTGL